MKMRELTKAEKLHEIIEEKVTRETKIKTKGILVNSQDTLMELMKCVDYYTVKISKREVIKVAGKQYEEVGIYYLDGYPVKVYLWTQADLYIFLD